MSSTTSSDCESCGCSQCTYSFENIYNDYGKLMTISRQVPIYATMAHPLIYYAEVPQTSNRRYDQPRKDNPFKKAFKWYTQERGRMLSNKNGFCPERSGFADWLDNKYDEYLRDNGQPANTGAGASRPLMTRDPRTPKDSVKKSCPGVSKTYGRLKSSWKKRRRSSVKDGGDVPEKGPCGSCEYILKPKDLTRATSELTPTSGGKSNATVTSFHMPYGKCTGRSRSLSDLGHERSVPRHGDTVTHFAQAPRSQEQEPVQILSPDCMCHQEPSKMRCKCPQCMCPSQKVPEVEEVSELAKEPSKKRHQPCCPCIQEKVKKRASRIQHPPFLLGIRLSEVVIQEPLIKEEPARLPYYPYPQEKVPQVEQLPLKIQNSTNPPMPIQNKLLELVKEPSIKKEPASLPYYPYPQEKVPQVEQLPLKIQNSTNHPMPLQENLPEVVQKPSIKEEPASLPYYPYPQAKVPQVEQLPLKIQNSTNPPMPLQKQLLEVVKEPSIKQEPARLPCCPYPQEKVPLEEQLPLKIQNSTKPPMPLQEKLLQVVKEPSIKQEPARLPYYPYPQEKVPQVEQLPLKIQSSTNPPMPLQKKLLEVVKEPSIKQEPLRLPFYPYPQKKVPQEEQLPLKIQSSTNPPMPIQAKLLAVVKKPSIKQEPTRLSCCPCPQAKLPQIEQLPSKLQSSTYSPMQLQEKLPEIIPEVVKLPSKVQNPSVQPGPCSKCNMKKVPQIVQVPSQSRAVQESCQVPEDKVFVVNEESQYEPSFKPPHNTPSLLPCCCNTCNPANPPPRIICLPVKVQRSKTFSPETYLTTHSSIWDPYKRQNQMTQKRSVSCQFDDGNKSKFDTQCQHQKEPYSCSKPYCSNFHAVNQACDPISIHRQSQSSVATNEDIGECSALKELAVVSKLTRSVTCASNDAAQTSDHSICFDKDGLCSCQCPLFLKIIYADIKE